MLGKELINLKGSKLGQILRADKTGFRRLDHILANALCLYIYITISILTLCVIKYIKAYIGTYKPSLYINA